MRNWNGIKALLAGICFGSMLSQMTNTLSNSVPQKCQLSLMYAITHIKTTYFQSFFYLSTPVHKATVTIKQTAHKNRQYGNLLLEEH